jgi:hypothetical protein
MRLTKQSSILIERSLVHSIPSEDAGEPLHRERSEIADLQFRGLTPLVHIATLAARLSVRRIRILNAQGQEPEGRDSRGMAEFRDPL